MDTRLRDGITRCAADASVLLAIKYAIEPDPDGKTMKFAIRNEDGKIYRTVHTTGPLELMRFTEAMENAGFVDELVDVTSMLDGFDGIYRLR